MSAASPKVVKHICPWQRLRALGRELGVVRLRCTKNHVFYLRGHPPFRVGSIHSPIAYVKCPWCEEKTSGGELL